MKTSATTTALHNAASGSVSRAGVWSRARSVLLRSVAACLAVVAVQQAASAQPFLNNGASNVLSGTYIWNSSSSWVGGVITNTVTGSFPSAATSGTLRFLFDSDYTLTSQMFAPNTPVVNGTATVPVIAAPSGTSYRLTFGNGGGWNGGKGAIFDQSLTLVLAAGPSGTVSFGHANQQATWINSKITGTGVLAIGAAGQPVYLTNPANDWQGGIFVGSITSGLSTTVAGAIPYGSGVSGSVVLAGMPLNIANTGTTGVNNLQGTTVYPSQATVGINGVTDFSSPTLAVYSGTNHTFGGRIQNTSGRNGGNLSLLKIGSGTMTLSLNGTTNNYSGATILEEGVLSISSIAQAGITGSFWGNFTAAGTVTGTMASTAGLQVGAKLYKNSANSGNWIATVTAVNSATTFSFNNPSSLGTGTLSAWFGVDNSIGTSSTNASNLVFNGGSLRYSGGTGSTNRLFSIGTGGGGIIADGTTGFLSFIGGGTIATPGTGARVFTLSGSNTGTNTLTTALANGSGGSTSLVKSGVGRWVLGGIHSYTGSTSIDSGSLLVNGTLGNTAVTVNSSGLLGGSGRIDGSVSVLSGGTFSPGTSPGVFSVGSDLTLAGTTLMEIDGTTRGSLYDGADVGGALTYGGAMSIVFNSSLTSAYADQTEFNFFDFASQSGSFTSITTQSNGAYYGGLTFTQSGTKWTATKTSGSQTQTLEFTPSTGNLVIVPEPLTLGLLGIGSGVAVLVVRRFRRRFDGGSNAT